MKKILVIDDDPEIVNLVRRRLEANRYSVVTAPDGEEGWDRMKQESPHLIILDVAMPKMDGYTFVLELKKNDELKGVPVIMLTAKDKMKALFELEGIRYYFVKPFVAEELLAKLREILGESEAAE